MGLADKVSQMGQQVNEGVRVTALTVTGWTLKTISGLVLGLTFALIGLEVAHYGNLAFLTVMFVVTGLTMQVLKSWSILNVLVFDLICILVGLALKMYIMLAP